MTDSHLIDGSFGDIEKAFLTMANRRAQGDEHEKPGLPDTSGDL
jgi:hypothetical protein